MPNETIYLNKKRHETLRGVPGENVSQKIGFVLDQYAEQRGEQQ